MDSIISLLKQLTPDLRPGYLREFHQQLFDAVKDGKLTEEEIKNLELKKEELGLTDDALGAVRQELYIAAFNSLQGDADVTDDEWDELEHIQDYLGLKDTDISKSKKELVRMRILSEIKKGNLPVVPGRDIIPATNELPHWSEAIELFVPSDKHNPEITSSRHTTADLTGWKKEDSGVLVITNKRVVLKGKTETDSVTLGRILDARPFTNGLLLHIPGRPPQFLKYIEKGNHNVVGSIVLHAIDRARRG